MNLSDTNQVELPQADPVPQSGGLGAPTERTGMWSPKERRRNLGDLVSHVDEAGVTPIPYLPVFGMEAFFVRGWMHLLSGFPKSGKTEFLLRVLAEWRNERIIYFTEESEVVWEYRTSNLPLAMRYALGHIEMVYCFEMSDKEILDEFASDETGAATVIVLDTIANILRFEDENNNAEVGEKMRRWLSVMRLREQTGVLLHHDNQRGGKGGRGIRGATAMLASVDVYLQILMAKEHGQRILDGNGRIIPLEKQTYVMDEDRSMRWVTRDEQRSALATATDRLRFLLGPGWQKTSEIAIDAGIDDSTADRALKSLVNEGFAERSIPLGEEARGKTIRWRRKQLL